MMTSLFVCQCAALPLATGVTLSDMQSGALLIEGAPLGSSTTLKGGTRFSIGSNADTSTCSTDFWGGLRREGVIDTSGMASSGRWAIGDLGGMGIGDGDSDEDDAGGGGFGDFGGYDVDDGGNGTGVEEAEDMMQEHMNPVCSQLSK